MNGVAQGEAHSRPIGSQILFPLPLVLLLACGGTRADLEEGGYLCRGIETIGVSMSPVSKEVQAVHVGQLRWGNKQRKSYPTRGSFLRN